MSCPECSTDTTSVLAGVNIGHSILVIEIVYCETCGWVSVEGWDWAEDSRTHEG